MGTTDNPHQARPEMDGVLITRELAQRPSRPPDHAAEATALSMLAGELASHPEGVLQKAAGMVVEMCHADSAGVSILELDGENELHRWHAIAGELAPILWNTMPCDASSFGTETTGDAVLLVREAELLFPDLAGVEPRIHETLLAPWHQDGKPVGALWAIKHTPEGRFDAEDARVVNVLAQFAAAAWHAVTAVQAAEQGQRNLAAKVEERTRALQGSEERYRILFESIDQGFCTVEVHFGATGRAVDYVFLEVNPAFARFTGLDNAVGRRMRDLAPAHEEHWFEIYGRVATTGIPERFEAEAAALGRWYNVCAFRVGEASAHRVGILFEDITERKQSETALRQSDERYRAIIEEATDYAIFATDAEGRIETWSPGAAAVLGWSADEAVGQMVDITFTPEDREAGIPMQELVTARDTGRAADVRWHLRCDGRRVFLDGTAYGMRGPDGIFRGILKIGQDVTERRRAEAALRSSEERLQKIVNIDNVGVLTLDSDGTVLRANDAFLGMLGYDRAEFEEKSLTWRVLTAPEYAEESERQFQQLAKTGRIGPYEKEYLRKDDSRTWMMLVGADLGDGTIVKYAIDISARKEAESALQLTQEQLDAALVAARMATWQWEPVTDEVVTSGPIGDLYGLLPGESYAASRRGFRLLHPEDAGWYRDLVQWAARNGDSWHCEFRIVRPRDGVVSWLEERATATRHPQSGEVRIAGFVWDISARKAAELALRESEALLAARVADATAELRTLSRRLLEVQEEERRHLALELHDEIGQVLTGLGLQLGVGKGTAEARRIVQELTEQVRQLSMDLRPAALDDYGLLPALEWHIERYQARTGVAVDFRHEGLQRRFPALIEITGFRVVQEALTNVARHAGSDLVFVQLLADADALTISVRDHGGGFDLASTVPSSGLGGMRERVDLVGGTIQIDSVPGDGTVVTVELPLTAAGAAGKGRDA